MDESRVVFFHPPTGVVTSQPFEGFELELLTGAGRLWRTRREGRWVAEWDAGAGSRSGWEEVLFEEVERPLAWQRGRRSGYRFGFGGPTEWERNLWPEHGPAVTIVVLPDLPGERAPANCPGARYGFQVGMICDGIPADYLAEKLFPRQLPDDLGELEDEEDDPDPEAEPTPAQEARWATQDQQRAAARALALDLSDDLVEAARELFGETVDYTSYSRKRAAEHRLRRFINPN